MRWTPDEPTRPAVARLRHARRPGRDRGRAAATPAACRRSTYALLARAADAAGPTGPRSPSCPTPRAGSEPLRRTFAELLADVHRYANLLHGSGVRRGDAVALMAPNCAELITATLAAQLAGIAAPLNGGLSAAHLAELLRRSGARVLVTAGPELAPADLGDRASISPREGLLDTILVLRPTAAAAAPAPLPAVDRGARRLPRRAGRRHRTRPAFAGDAAALRRSRRAVPHRRHHRGAEAGRAHPRQRGRRRLDAGRHTRCSTPDVGGASPRCRCSTSTRWSSPLLAPLFKGQQVVWAGPLGYRDPALFGAVLDDRRALPDRRDERGADRLRRARRSTRSTPTSAACASPWSAPHRCPPRSATASRPTPASPCSRATG